VAWALEVSEPAWESEPASELELLIRTNSHHSRSTHSRSRRTTLS